MRALQEKEFSVLENTLDTEVEENPVLDVPGVRYGFNEHEEFRQPCAEVPVLDYQQLWYGEKTSTTFFSEEDYWTGEVPADTAPESMTTEEAQKTFVDIQYNTVMGAISDMNCGDRHRFDVWIKFNRDLFGVFERLYAVTQEVNYAPPA